MSIFGCFANLKDVAHWLNTCVPGRATLGHSIYGVPNIYVAMPAADVNDFLSQKGWLGRFWATMETDGTCWVYRRGEDAAHGQRG